MKNLFTACACIALVAAGASAQLAPNQTNGFGNGKSVTFLFFNSRMKNGVRP